MPVEIFFFQFLRHILYLGGCGGGALKCKERPSASHAHPTLEHGALRRMLCYKGALPRLQGPKVGTIGRVLSVDLSITTSHNSVLPVMFSLSLTAARQGRIHNYCWL